MLTTERLYRRLLDPADLGELTLPEEVQTARAVVARLTAARTGLTPPDPPQSVLDAAVRATLTADDPATVDLAPVLDHERTVRAFEVRAAVLNRALDLADDDLRGALADNTERIVVQHVRPAGEQLWVEIVKCVKALAGIDTINTDSMLRAGDRARRAYLDMDTLAARYDRLRGAWSPLPNGQPVQHDVHGDHAEFEAGLCTVFGPGWRGVPTGARPGLPWPDDPRGRLIWLVRNGRTPWWPLPAERDAAWMEAHREAFELMQRRQALHHTAHGTRRTA